ncbi:hypothetical protein GOODEAATRI_026218, partial [Goodea atripinnis]
VYNNAGLVSVGGVITANVPPPPYHSSHKIAGYSKPGNPQNTTPGVNSGPLLIPHGSTPSNPAPPQASPAQPPPPTTPITPVFPGMVPSHNLNAPSPSPAPSPSVIKAGPQIPSGHVTPTPSSVIKAHTPSGTPCGTPVPGSGGFSSSPFHGLSRPGTPAASRSGHDSQSQSNSMGSAQQRAYSQSTDQQSGPSFSVVHPQGGNPSGSVIRSYTSSPLTPGSSTPVIPNCSTPGPSPKPSPVNPAQAQAQGVVAGTLNRHSGGSNSGSNSPVPSAFKGTSRSGLSPFPALSSLPSATIPSSVPPSTNHPPSSVYQGLAPGAAPNAASPFALDLTSGTSIFPGLSPGPNPTTFPRLAVSGGAGTRSPVLPSFMGLSGAAPSSVASVAPLQATAVGVPSSPVLPGFASAFSSNFQPGYVNFEFCSYVHTTM